MGDRCGVDGRKVCWLSWIFSCGERLSISSNEELGNQFYALIIVPCACFDMSFVFQHRAGGNLGDRRGEVVGMTFLGWAPCMLCSDFIILTSVMLPMEQGCHPGHWGSRFKLELSY